MKKILLVILGLVVAFLLIGLFLPKHVSRARTITIAADRARIHELVSNLERWPEWTPWQEADPSVKTTLGAIKSGAGASQSWTGKDGDGELTLTKSDPNEGIAYDMAFKNGEHETPMKSAMLYRPNGNATDVTWSFEGDFDVPVIGGWLVMFMGGSIDAMFDKGLQKLKAKAEAK